MTLPLGSRIWVAQAANAFVDREMFTGDATVIALIPCSACWQAARPTARTAADLYAAGLTCHRPTGVIARTDAGRRIAICDNAPDTLAVPIAAEASR
jgi:hypothetical protein